MARGFIITILLILSLAVIANSQYIDLLQGFQQLFQPYQAKRPVSQNFGITTQINRQNNKQENRTKKPDERRKEQRKKKPATNQYDYLFVTTTKPSRKTTKFATNSRSSNKNRNFNSDFFLFNFDTTTKPSRRTTTRRYNNNFVSTTTTTEKNVVNQNRDTPNNKPTDNRKSDKYIFAGNYDLNNNNRGVTNNNNYNINNKYSTISPNRGINTENNRNSNQYYNTTNANRVTTEYNNFLGNNRGTITNNKQQHSTQTPTRVLNLANNSNRGTQNNRPGTNRYEYYSTTTPKRGINTENNRYTGDNNNKQNNSPDTGSRNVNVAIFNNDRTNTDTIPNNRNDEVYNKGVIDNKFVATTNYPLLQRPGVRPLVDAITNRPDTDGIAFPIPGGYLQVESPDWLVGPDEDQMTSLQKKRYIDLAETMCERYKALNVKKVVALPLVPSPSPVEINVTSCSRITVPLIIGGTVVDIKDFPHMALIGWMTTRQYGYSWKCGGSLISDNYVLTAAHCVYQDRDYDSVSGPPQAVQLGSTYLDDPGALVVKISAVIRHPKYKTRRSYHDVALIKLVKIVTFSEVIRPACIGVAPSPGNNIIATGWGRTEFGGDHSSELRSVSLPVWDMRECRQVWGTSLKLPQGPTPESHVCAGDRSGQKDTCQGDSGGPAQIQDGCIWRVVAVTSHGRSCGSPQIPALYAVIPKAFVAAQVFGGEVDYGGRGDHISNRRDEEYFRNK